MGRAYRRRLVRTNPVSAAHTHRDLGRLHIFYLHQGRTHLRPHELAEASGAGRILLPSPAPSPDQAQEAANNGAGAAVEHLDSTDLQTEQKAQGHRRPAHVSREHLYLQSFGPCLIGRMKRMEVGVLRVLLGALATDPCSA